MSNYYLDTEFHEYKRRGVDTIELISIGIISQTGRRYYAICDEFDLKAAWNSHNVKIAEFNKFSAKEGDFCYVYWDDDVAAEFEAWKKKVGRFKKVMTKGEPYKEYWLRDNVLRPIYDELINVHQLHRYIGGFTRRNMAILLNWYGKSKKEIKEEIIEFTACSGCRWEKENGLTGLSKCETKHNFYAYYADYDWVVFCWLFGRMIDLPDHYNMYCRDLKQMMDDTAMRVTQSRKGGEVEYAGLEEGLKFLKKHPDYPKQLNEHNALADAEWNQRLHKFLENVK